MPVSAKKFVYDFYRKRGDLQNRTQETPSFVDAIAYINEGLEIWYRNKTAIAQTDQEVRNDLRIWKMDKVKLELKEKDSDCLIAKYPSDLYFRLNQVAIATKDCCPGITKRIPIRMNQSDDIQETLRNPFRRANYFYEQLNAVEASNGLIIYHQGEIDIESVEIDYYRRPKEIHAPSHSECANGYYDYDGKLITKDQDFEGGDTFAQLDIVDIAVLLSQRDAHDMESFQSQLTKIFQKRNFV